MDELLARSAEVDDLEHTGCSRPGTQEMCAPPAGTAAAAPVVAPAL
jgi:hypothetical protein